ncbi:MAG: hypothetical protein EPO26_01910 [Chloroflexota bacterium]|nr:MAG: hypothetical protein EPO26_01910 [Chloroflexota bacterium]
MTSLAGVAYIGGVLDTCVREVAAHLNDTQLRCEIDCVERCAFAATRTRREIALVRLRCLRAEMERRQGARALATAS